MLLVKTRGVFIVPFTTMLSRDNILKGGFQFFDKKPIFIKAMAPTVDITKEVG